MSEFITLDKEDVDCVRSERQNEEGDTNLLLLVICFQLKRIGDILKNSKLGRY